MKKTIMALLLSAIFSAACFATVPYPLHEDIGSAPANTSSTVSQFSDVWEYWSQGGSMYYVMRRWGCHAVAHTKLLVECGAASDDVSVFNPDVYFDWGVENGFYNRSDMLEQWGIYGPASDVVTYANANGVKLKKNGTVSLSGANSVADGNKVMQYINAGYYVIVTCKAHQAYVGREASVQAGKPILLDSWGSKSYYDGTCVEFVGYNLANFNELMYFEVEGEVPAAEFNPEPPDFALLPPVDDEWIMIPDEKLVPMAAEPAPYKMNP